MRLAGRLFEALSSREVHQPGICSAEPARVEVEPREFRLEIDVKPLTASGLGIDDRPSHKLGTDSPALIAATRFRVDKERVITPVPGDVDESDQEPIVVAGADPAETVRPDSGPPPGTRVAAVRRDEIDHLGVGNRFPPGIGDHIRHISSLPDIGRAANQ